MTWHRLLADRRGGAGAIVGIAMPVLIGAAALAVDVGSVQLESRRLQGIADAAALAAAVDPASAQARAEGAVAATGWPHAIRVVAQSGGYRADAAPGARFVPGAGEPDAARVTVTATSPAFLARIFGERGVAVTRTAVAARQDLAAFSIGTRLARVEGGLLNAYLGALARSQVSLTAMDYDALAAADVDLFGWLEAVRTTAGIEAASFDDLLRHRVSGPHAVEALAAALTREGRVSAPAALRRMTIPTGRDVALDAIADVGPYGRQSTGPAAMARVNALALLTALLQIASPERQVTVNLGAALPGIASARATIAVGERVRQSPWIAVTRTGEPIVRTAQARVYVEATLAPAAVAGLLAPVSLRVPLVVELAGGEGRLAVIACPTADTRAVTVEARPRPATAALGEIDPATLGDFSAPLSVSAAAILAAPLVSVAGSARLELGAAEPWTPLRFDAAAIAAGERRSVRSIFPVGGVAASLMQAPGLTARVAGLPLPLDPLLRSVGGTLAGSAPALDQLIQTATGVLGVSVGEADVRVTGVRCGTAALVG